ncbi:MAG: prepilin-type N-terminal cleavage/methylation domain-containing protein [Lachnospiraceae bacterium]|nr:prepilin-type N-terminal cleavage/methylation domain-containing protein [Lachnospiraceae bacterium]
MSEDKMIRNQGMSLVELLVSVAVLGIAMIGILSLINLSTKYYSNSSKEVEVQSELQTTFAMVSNMLVDANAGVTYTSSTKKAVIANRNKKYVVQLSGTKLYAKMFNASDAESGVISDNNLLADHVEYFVIDTSHYDDGYVTMGMRVKYGSREASMTKNVFLRNTGADIGDFHADCAETEEEVTVGANKAVKYTLVQNTGAGIPTNTVITLRFKLTIGNKDIGSIYPLSGLQDSPTFTYNKITGVLTVRMKTSGAWNNGGSIAFRVSTTSGDLPTEDICITTISK